MTEGDHIENDLEAICYAIKKYPENKENIVLIADNWEDPCDMQLIDFLKKEKVPVKIIICGVEDRLNTLYLELAHATGGSIHTMEEDLKDIAKIGEGKRFKIGKMKFYMAGGKFIQEYGYLINSSISSSAGIKCISKCSKELMSSPSSCMSSSSSSKSQLICISDFFEPMNSSNFRNTNNFLVFKVLRYSKLRLIVVFSRGFSK
jgi:hypothetical protein